VTDGNARQAFIAASNKRIEAMEASM